MGDGIEFLGELGPEPDPDEERLDLGPRRGGPRWGVIVGALVVAAALVAVLTTHHDGRPDAAATHRATRGVTVGPSLPVGPGPATSDPGLQFLAPSAFASLAGPVVTVGAFADTTRVGDGEVVAAAFLPGGGGLVVLEPGFLARAELLPGGGLSVPATATVPRELGDPAYPTSGGWQLIGGGARMWALAPGVPFVYEFQPRTLSGLRLIRVPGVLVGAAELDGRLYIATDRGLYDLAPGTDRFTRRSARRDLRAVAADPSRHRLMLLERDSGRTSVDSFVPTQPAATVRRDLVLPAPDIAVVAGRIWLAGQAAGVSRVQRLDPRTLQVVGYSRLSGLLGLAANVVATGPARLWLRSDGTADALWCVDARTGAVAQRWTAMPGVVAAGAAGVVVAYPDPGGTGGSVLGRLRLNDRCTG